MKYNIVDATDASKLGKGPTPPIGFMIFRGAEILFFENIADAIAYPLRSEKWNRITPIMENQECKPNETEPEQIIEIVKGKVESGNCVYEFVLGYCEGRVYPYVTIDYRVLPDGKPIHRFAGRSPQGLVAILTDHDYPIPDILTQWCDQTLKVTVSMLSNAEDETLEGLRKHYIEQLTEEDIEGFIRKEVSELFQESTITLALYTYWGIRAANDWNKKFDEILQSERLKETHEQTQA